MLQIAQHLERVPNNLMRSSSFYISNKTHATSIVLIAWVIQTLFLWSIYHFQTRIHRLRRFICAICGICGLTGVGCQAFAEDWNW